MKRNECNRPPRDFPLPSSHPHGLERPECPILPIRRSGRWILQSSRGPLPRSAAERPRDPEIVALRLGAVCIARTAHRDRYRRPEHRSPQSKFQGHPSWNSAGPEPGTRPSPGWRAPFRAGRVTGGRRPAGDFDRICSAGSLFFVPCGPGYPRPGVLTRTHRRRTDAIRDRWLPLRNIIEETLRDAVARPLRPQSSSLLCASKGREEGSVQLSGARANEAAVHNEFLRAVAEGDRASGKKVLENRSNRRGVFGAHPGAEMVGTFRHRNSPRESKAVRGCSRPTRRAPSRKT